jgi:hypothetical protein
MARHASCAHRACCVLSCVLTLLLSSRRLNGQMAASERDASDAAASMSSDEARSTERAMGSCMRVGSRSDL